MDNTAEQSLSTNSACDVIPLHRLIEALTAYCSLSVSVDSSAAGCDRSAAARNLLAVVQGLPELRGREETAARARDDELVELRAAVAELDGLDANGPHFRLLAEEIVARARALQERSPVDEPGCSAIVRRVTRSVPPGVFILGLARAHRGNWELRAVRARAARESLRLKSSVAQAAQARPESETCTVPDSPPPACDVPLLRKAAEQGAVVVLGGAGLHAVRHEVVRRASLDIEWVETRGDGGTRIVQALAKRVRDDRVTALVVVEGAIRHDAYGLVIDGARARGVPVAYAKKGGLTQVLQSLSALEARLARDRESSPALEREVREIYAQG